MQQIDLDASIWTSEQDFYRALLGALGAPRWHGTSVDALVDSMIYGGINEVEPPLVVRISGCAQAPRAVQSEIEEACAAIRDGREECLALCGRYVDVSIDWKP